MFPLCGSPSRPCQPVLRAPPRLTQTLSPLRHPVICLFVCLHLREQQQTRRHDGCVGVRGEGDVSLQAAERGRDHPRRQIHPQIQGGGHGGDRGESVSVTVVVVVVVVLMLFTCLCGADNTNTAVELEEESHLELCRQAGDAKCAVSLQSCRV